MLRSEYDHEHSQVHIADDFDQTVVLSSEQALMLFRWLSQLFSQCQGCDQLVSSESIQALTYLREVAPFRIQTTTEGFRDYVLLLVFLDTGMRLSELCGLKLTDLDSQFRYVKVFGKGRKEREIGLHPEVGKLVWKYIHKYRKPADPDEMGLFLGRRGEPLKPSGVATLIDRIEKQCGLEGVRVSPHTFRHTFAKFYLQRGGEVFKLSREMGHGTVQVTELYLKDFRSSEARQEHTSYSPVGEIDLKKKKKKDRKKDSDE